MQFFKNLPYTDLHNKNLFLWKKEDTVTKESFVKNCQYIFFDWTSTNSAVQIAYFEHKALHWWKSYWNSFSSITMIYIQQSCQVLSFSCDHFDFILITLEMFLFIHKNSDHLTLLTKLLNCWREIIKNYGFSYVNYFQSLTALQTKFSLIQKQDLNTGL